MTSEVDRVNQLFDASVQKYALEHVTPGTVYGPPQLLIDAHGEKAANEMWSAFCQVFISFHVTKGHFPFTPAELEECQNNAFWQALVRPSETRELIKAVEFQFAMKAAGINLPGLTEDPVRTTALVVLSDPNGGSMEKRLKKLGITDRELQVWLSDPEFSSKLNQLTEENFSRYQFGANAAIQQKALKGDLNAIRYYNELSGRHDPTAKARLDVEKLVRGLVDILTEEVDDRELLERVGARIKTLIGALDNG